MIALRETVQRCAGYSYPPADRRGKLCLDLNENSWGCSPQVRRALRGLSRDDISRYPDYHLLQDRLAQECGASADNIALFNGSGEGIAALFQAFVAAGEEVVLPWPTFSLFGQFAQLAGAKIVQAPYGADGEFPRAAVAAALNARTKMLVLVSPGSPVGGAVPWQAVQEFAAQMPSGLVVVDEAYTQYAGVTILPAALQMDNVLVLRTFSKVYGLAGLRLGYLCAQPAIIAALQRVQLPFSANAAAVAAALAALADRAFVARVAAQTAREKRYLEGGLARLGLECVPTSANFSVARVGEGAPWLQAQLAAQGILVKLAGDCAPVVGCLRIAIGQRRQNRQLLGALNAILKEKRRAS